MFKASLATLTLSLAVSGLSAHAALTAPPSLKGVHKVFMQYCSNPAARVVTKQQEFTNLFVQLTPIDTSGTEFKDQVSIYGASFAESTARPGQISSDVAVYISHQAFSDYGFPAKYAKLVNQQLGAMLDMAVIYTAEDQHGLVSMSERVEAGSTGMLNNSYCAVGEVSTIYIAPGVVEVN